jgi:hypothetical protein
VLQATVCIIHTRWCDRFVHRVAFVATKLFSPLIALPPHRTTVVLCCTTVTLQQDNKSQLINKTHIDDAALCKTAVIVFPSTRNPCSKTWQTGRSNVSVKTGKAKRLGYIVAYSGHLSENMLLSFYTESTLKLFRKIIVIYSVTHTKPIINSQPFNSLTPNDL